MIGSLSKFSLSPRLPHRKLICLHDFPLSQAHGSLSLSPRLDQGLVRAVGFGGRLWVMEVVGMVGIWLWALVCEFWPWVLVVAVCLVIVGLYEWVGDDSVCIVEW
jgi:hypothetical protein|uniref:Transmembrane protein n=1 Tax=Fagus sylvatica TaxID=28930 RepID=A0A2N9EUN1_FAGSY